MIVWKDLGTSSVWSKYCTKGKLHVHIMMTAEITPCYGTHRHTDMHSHSHTHEFNTDSWRF